MVRRTSASARRSSTTTRACRTRSRRTRRASPGSASRRRTSGSSICCSRCGRSRCTSARDCSAWSDGRRPRRRSLSPLIVSVTGYGYEHGSYTWQGLGVYTQLFGMWLLPIAWGLTWRAVSKGEKWYAPAALTLALHDGDAPHDRLPRGADRRRVGPARAGAVSCSGSGAPRSCRSARSGPRRGCSSRCSRIATTPRRPRSTRERSSTIPTAPSKIIAWLRTGELFDHGRFPIFTLLVVVGFVMCVIRAAAFRSGARGARRVDA